MTKPSTKTTTTTTIPTRANVQVQSAPVVNQQSAPVVNQQTAPVVEAQKPKGYLPKRRTDDIWNTPSSSDVVIPRQRSSYNPTKYLPNYQDGGLNEGMEADLSLEQIKQLQSQGYKIEIL